MAKKKTKQGEVYRVLIACHNGDTGQNYLPDKDTVTNKDFPQSVIDNWLELDPPVLEVVTDGSTE